MDKTKKFSIVICTYNGEKTIGMVIDSILSQRNVESLISEINVIDNNSYDETKNIIKSYMDKSRLVNYTLELKQGLSHARKHAVKSKSEWVIYIDDDNILLDDWLVELDKFISEHPNIGIVNGAVAPYPYINYTQEERAMLNAMYRNLACTTLDLDNNSLQNTESIHPFGAGLCIKTEGLKILESEGWLQLEGRKGEILSSGEDGEMTSRLMGKGYRFMYNPKMRLHHYIPSARLSKAYMDKLITGLSTDYYSFIKMKNNGRLKLITRFVYYLLKIRIIEVSNWFLFKENENKIKKRYQIHSYKTFIKLFLKDQYNANGKV